VHNREGVARWLQQSGRCQWRLFAGTIHAACIGGESDTDPARRLRNGGSSESHVRACFRAGDPPTLALALDVCGEPTSSRSRSSQVYAGRIGGMVTEASGGGAEYDAKRACSDS
jgi:hypothetical protein